MKLRTFRLRRVVAAVTLGVGALGGIVLGAAGTASAAVTYLGSITATSTTTIPAGPSTGQAIGSLKVTTAKTAPHTFYLVVGDTTSGVVNTFPHVATWATTVTFTPKTTGAITVTCHEVKASDFITCTYVRTPAGSSTFTFSGLKVNSTTGSGKVKVVATFTVATETFLPKFAFPATYAHVPKTPTHVYLVNNTARPIPPIGEGATGTTVGTWTLRIAGNPGTGVKKGEYVLITVRPGDVTGGNPTHKNLCTATHTDAVAFDGTPTVTLTTTTTVHVTSTPKFSTSLVSTTPGCIAKFAPNALKITFTNTVFFTGKATATFAPTASFFTLEVTGVKYTIGTKTTRETVTVSDQLWSATTVLLWTGTTQDATHVATRYTLAGTALTSTNALVSHMYVTANSPSVTVAANAYEHPISSLNLVESTIAPVGTPWVCLTLRGATRPGPSRTYTGLPYTGNHNTGLTLITQGVRFNAASTPTVKVTGTATASGATLTFTTTTVAFRITTPGTTPSTFSVSGLSVNLTTVPSNALPAIVTAYYATTTGCTAYSATGFAATTSPTDNVAVAFVIKPVSTVIYGATADATAVAELEHAFVPGVNCPGTTFTGHFSRTVLLATTGFFSDALASQYMARYLNTGVLLTPGTHLARVTATALRAEGIQHVYIVGGPLAIDTTVVNEVKSLTKYTCGGRRETLTTTTKPAKLVVTRIYGTTEYTTAADIAEFVPVKHVPFWDLAGAYAGVNTTGGNGLYNDTAGSGSAHPLVSGRLATAILATGTTWQDAESASALAYYEEMPILLTKPTSLPSVTVAALQDLNIKQVILMGGQIAVSNTVVTTLEGMTITVIRVAGKDYTDTAVKLATMEFASAGLTLGFTYFGTGKVLIARGDYYTDGLAGAVLEHRTTGVPLLLTFNPSTLGSYLPTFLKGVNAAYGVTHATILGGPLAVTPAEIAAIDTDIAH